MNEKIQKTNIVYLLSYIFIPLVVAAFSILIGALCFKDGGTGAVITFMLIPIIAVVWWIFGGSLIFRQQTRELEQKFASEGYRRNHTFYGRGKTVVLDINKGMIGLVFYWNPGKFYILPASRVNKAWVDDGKMGSGFMEGSSRVSFLFTIDDIKVRVDTFTSNQRFRMDDKHILTGISKADMMVQRIEEAKANSKAESHKSTEKPSQTEKASEKSDQSPKSSKKSTEEPTLKTKTESTKSSAKSDTKATKTSEQ